MTITFLGTGTSMGVPMIGCDCAVCRSSDARDRRLRSSVYVETDECAWVVDTGTDFRLQCLRENVTRLDAVLFTHGHTDHIMGFDDLRPFCFDGDLPVFASEETLAVLRRVFPFAFDGNHRVPGYVRPAPQVVRGPFLLGATEVTPLPVLHGRCYVNGYLFCRHNVPLAAYLSDCKIVPEDVIQRIRGVRVLILDALRHREHPTHLTVDQALEVARRVRPAATWFTHICHELSHAATEALLPPEVRLAYDGLKLELE